MSSLCLELPGVRIYWDDQSKATVPPSIPPIIITLVVVIGMAYFMIFVILVNPLQNYAIKNH
jgi:hypothetical protein